MRFVRTSLTLAIMSFLCACQLETEGPPITPGPLWGDLAPGEYSIGFTLLHVDVGRQGAKDSRTVRVALWYPSDAPGKSQGIRFGQYLDQRPEVVLDEELERWANGRDRKSLQRQYFGDNAATQTDSLMRAPTAAVPGATPKLGRFPLVLHSLGRNGGQYESTILWEYLASHGYVVASVGQLGRSLEDPSLEFTFEDQALQLDDMRSALLYLTAFNNVDSNRVGLLGHSSGAIVALWLAAENDRVKAVVSLDGSVNRTDGRHLLESGLDENANVAPLLNLCRWPHPEFDSGTTDGNPGSVIRIGYERAIHFDFQNWPAYQAYTNAIEERSLKVRTVDEARRVFESAAVFTRLFLDAELRDDNDAGSKLRDADEVAGISDGLATLEIVGATKGVH